MVFNENNEILMQLRTDYNAFMRNLKRLFLDKDKVLEPKNLEIFKTDTYMYIKFNKRLVLGGIYD